LLALGPVPLEAQAPHFAQGAVRPALIVDGAPFLVLGAQANNSSNYPAMLDQVWPMVERLGANTLLMPVAWEQVEPAEGQFDFASSMRCSPGPRSRQTAGAAVVRHLEEHWCQLCARVGQDRRPALPAHALPDGASACALSPHGAETLAADARAFARLMRALARDRSASTP
jgi:hypothetical protein